MVFLLYLFSCFVSAHSEIFPAIKVTQAGSLTAWQDFEKNLYELTKHVVPKSTGEQTGFQAPIQRWPGSYGEMDKVIAPAELPAPSMWMAGWW